MTITLVPYAGLCNRILAGKIYGTPVIVETQSLE